MSKKKKKGDKEPIVTETPVIDSPEELEPEIGQIPIVFNLPGPNENEAKNPRIVTLYGDIDEETCSEIVKSLLMYSPVIHPPSEGEPIEPIKLYISTWGGSAADMFSIYDLIKSMRDVVPVHTTGLGKVMSGGVVLLAAGEKGHRKIGANCRVMFHGVQAGHAGTIYNLENEMEEAKWTQKRYIDALVEETNMTAKYLKKLVDRKLNVYFSAEQAIELGIADEII